MKHIQETISLLLAAATLVLCLGGCGGTAATSTSEASAPEEPVSAVTEAPVPESEPEQVEVTPESISETISVAEAEEEPLPVIEPLVPDADGNVTITDMAGRTVTYPAYPMVWNSSPTAEGWLCAIAPEQIIGWAAEFTEEQLSYFPESVRELPVLGGNYGSNEANVEGIIAYGPDVIINTFDVSTDEAKASAAASADAMAEQYGIPVICLSRDIRDTAVIAGNLGQWLGQEERGAEVQAYLETVMSKINETIAAVPEDAVVTYYYAEGMDGLSTESKDSFHADVYIYCGLEAAVGDDVTLSSFGGMEAVSMEQVLGWDPEYIFVWNAGAYETILSDPSWSDITAVKDGHVYLNPTLPQNWVDRSPNSLRILGCLFTAATCYPDYCTYDLDAEIQDFFQFMYGVELTGAQLDALH